MDFGGGRGLSGQEEMSYAPTAVSVPGRGLIESARRGDEFAASGEETEAECRLGVVDGEARRCGRWGVCDTNVGEVG